MRHLTVVCVKKHFLVLSIISFISISAFAQASDKLQRLGSIVPGITCEGMIGDCVPLESLKGKMVLIEFWSSSNHSSMVDHVELQKIYDDYKDATFKNGSGFEVYSIALDNSEDRWQLARIRDNNSWPFSMCNPDKWNAKVARDYNIQTIPRYFLINGDGELIENLFLMKDLRVILARYALKVR